MEKLDRSLLRDVKRAFVAMPSGADPAAMGGMMPQAQAAPMGGAPMDPSMGGMPPMDPSMGGAPMDPSMGGMPPMDPAAMGSQPGTIQLNPQEFTDLISVILSAAVQGKAVSAGGGSVGKEAGEGKKGVEAKLDMIIQALGGAQQQ